MSSKLDDSHFYRTFITEKSIWKFIIKKTGKEIPIKSYVRSWLTPDGHVMKYEFRSKDYQGYHNPSELILKRTNG